MLITHATLIRWLPRPAIEPDAGICIRDGLIAEIGPTAELVTRYPAEVRLDAQGLWLLPGLICAHTHLYGAFARGIPPEGPPPADFPAILRGLWWRLDRALTPEDCRYSALVALCDCIRHGVTTIFDHHASPSAARGSLDVLAEAVTEAGLRASLSYEVSDRDGLAAAAEGIAENVRFLESPSVRTPTLRGLFGLHASLTLSEATVRQAVEAASSLGVGFHVHVAEGEADVAATLARDGLRPVERWMRLGVLSPRTIAAHCVHVEPAEIELLKETGTRVVHNPRSNMNNAVGAAPTAEMLHCGIPLGLGNDGFGQDLWHELELAFLLPRHTALDPRASDASAYVDLLLRHNPATASAAFGLPVGAVQVGAAADLILVRYEPPTPVTPGNLAWHLISGLGAATVDTTIVNGRVLMRRGELQTLDEGAIAARARELAAALWQRLP